jgi:hypothetical protein
MNSISNYFRSAKRIGAAVTLAATMVVGAGFATTADAQTYRINGRDYIVVQGNQRGDIRQVAAANGYSAGFERGERDRRSRQGFNFRNDTAYQRATAGYQNSWGRLNDYRTYFRQGYVQGYNDGYNNRARSRNFDRARVWNNRVYDYRNSPYDPYYNFPSYGNFPSGSYQPYYSNERGDESPREVAQRGAQNGYYAGFQRGQYDAAQRLKANPQGHGAYQFGFDGFDPEWGSAATYQSNYRNAFVQGYHDGYSRRSFNQRFNRRF